jgi:copper homeostasis protein
MSLLPELLPKLLPELEICIESLAAGLAASAGGADCVELCTALNTGGLTPSHGLIAMAVEQLGLPVHVLVRPRAGGFFYSRGEFRIMAKDIEHARSAGARGCVVGLLDREGCVDVERTRELVQLAAPMQITFHRAFDRSKDLSESLERVIEAGCARVLTSGGQQTVAEGAATLAALVKQAAGRIRIAAGGGVTLASAEALLKLATVDLHASLRHAAPASADGQNDPLWDPERSSAIDPSEVRDLAALLRHAATQAQPQAVARATTRKKRVQAPNKLKKQPQDTAELS